MRLTQQQIENYCQKNGIDINTLLDTSKFPGYVYTVEPKDKRNKTEIRFENEILKPLQHAGKVVHWWFGQMKFKIGNHTCWYEPDYVVLYSTGQMTVCEIKGGYVTEDGHIKFKVASMIYPFFNWEMWQYDNKTWNKKHGG